MGTKENIEEQALKKSILPVVIYLTICFSLFFVIYYVSINANNFLGIENIRFVNILKGILIGLLTTFLIFYLIFKYKFVEINANLNLELIINSAPYLVFVCRLSDFSISSCSASMHHLLGYSVNEIKSLTLGELMTENSFKLLVIENEDKHYINKDFENIGFIKKNLESVTLNVNVMKYELLEKDYLIIRCRSDQIADRSSDKKEKSSGEEKNLFTF